MKSYHSLGQQPSTIIWKPTKYCKKWWHRSFIYSISALKKYRCTWSCSHLTWNKAPILFLYFFVFEDNPKWHPLSAYPRICFRISSRDFQAFSAQIWWESHMLMMISSGHYTIHHRSPIVMNTIHFPCFYLMFPRTKTLCFPPMLLCIQGPRPLPWVLHAPYYYCPTLYYEY